MKTLVAAFITALLVFALATVWIDAVQPRLDKMASAASSQSNERLANGQHRRSSRRSIDEELDDEDEETSRLNVRSARTKKSSRGKTSQRDAKNDQLLVQLEQVKREEAKLVERQNTMKLLYEDIYRELASLEEVRRRSAMELAMVEQQILGAALNKPTVASTSAESRTAAAPPKARRSGGEIQIADIVQNLVNRGRSPAAGVLLSGLKDFEVAKVLSVLNSRDPKLALRLSNEVQTARQNTVQRN